jgi:hypothetical protein
MKIAAIRIALICLVSGAACTNEAEPPVILADGMVQYTTSRTHQTVPCDGRPIDVAGDRNTMEFTGPCQYVRVSGAHNDIFIDIVPGGTIEITGDHNDVSWRRIKPGAHQILQDRGQSNTFHPMGDEG